MEFDKNRTKHELFHLSLSLATVLLCTSYLHYRRNWTHIGSFWNSAVIPIVLVGEFLKVILARFYGRGHFDDGSNAQKQRQKKLSSLASELSGGLMLLTFSTILYAFTCVILGAPMDHNYEQTFMLALLLTLMTVLPTVFLLGGGGTLQVCFCEKNDFTTKSEDTALNLFKYNALGAILGAWAGSVVAPLDWEREWQVYPIPNMIGALLGSALGNLYACVRVLYSTAKVYLNKRR